MMRTLLLFSALVCLSGCAIPQPGMYGPDGETPLGGVPGSRIAQPTASYVDETLQVVTDPPGAGVLVNNTYYGQAPIQVPVRRYWRGAPGNMALDLVVVKARPKAGQCEQEVVLGQNAQPSPPQVFLNMYNCAGGYEAPRRK